MYSQLVRDYRIFLRSSLSEIYDMAFDGENIQEDKAIGVISNFAEKKYGIHIQNKFTLSPQLRTGEQYNTNSELLEFFSNDQMILINDLLSYESINPDILFEIRNRASQMQNREEALLMVDIIDLIDVSLQEILIFESDEDTLSSGKYTFGCNVAAGAVGWTFGFIAGALTGSVAGPAGIFVGNAVGILVSAAISTYACPYEVEYDDDITKDDKIKDDKIKNDEIKEISNIDLIRVDWDADPFN